MALRARIFLLAAVTTVTITAPSVFGQNRFGDYFEPRSQQSARTLVGVWLTQVRPRNCETNEPLPAPVLAGHGLFTFHQGGTASEYGIGPGQSPSLRSPGHGVWRRASRRQDHDYEYEFIFTRHDASGAFVGSAKVTSALVLDESGDAWTSRSQVEVFDAAGNLILAPCVTGSGTRFE
jgi:hypothetical protein